MSNSLQEFDQVAQIRVVLHNASDLELIGPYLSETCDFVTLDELRKKFPILVSLEASRPRLEFIYALTPFIVKYFQEIFPTSQITYVDADLFFLGKVEVLTNLAAKYDVGITPHRFKREMLHLEEFGRYNVGLVQFNETKGSQRVLDFWIKACTESTSTVVSPNVFGDQKYLDRFHEYGEIFVFNSPGVNAAPWNTDRVLLNEDRNYISVENEQLYFFHFSGLKIFKRFATLSYIYYEWKPKKSIKKHLYRGYISRVVSVEIKLYGHRKYDKRRVNFRQRIRFLLNGDFLVIKNH
jgi:hypothetical protein